ncbi:unnamed protein product [Clonostachys rhizophaga]|uniref:Nuclear distribution protein PAC1 n=2 Tax=Clonostachys TaxID=110564 RepID=A0A8H7TVY6_BIOOC|nr:unnamed protein product [Clonostachys rhizophaga]
MSRLLTTRQAEELHKSMIAYLLSAKLPNTAAALREEIGLEESTFDAETAKKYEGLLEKKWTSVVRLQKKIMDLESKNAALQTELDNATPLSFAKRSQDPSAWLPRSPPRYSLESHRDAVNCIAFHPAFSSIASGSADCTIKIWDWEFGELEKTIKGHTKAVQDLDFGGPKGATLLASCASDLTIKLWDPADDYKNIRTLQGHDHSISTVRFIPSGTGGSNMLVSASGDNTLKIWDTTTGYCVKTLTGHSGWVRHVDPSIDGRYLVSTGNDRTARIWDLSMPNPENTVTMFGHENVIKCCALAPPASYKHLANLAGLKNPPSASSTAEFVATGSRDKTIKLWDSRGTCLKTLVGHDNWVSALVFHPGGKYLLSVADDKTLRCWDLSQEGKCVKVLEDTHEQFITCLRWVSGSNRGDAAANGDGKAGDDKKGDAPGQFRCVIATGGMDSAVKIFAN